MSLWNRLRTALALMDYVAFAIGGCVVSLLILPARLFGRHAARRWGAFLLRLSWWFMTLALRLTCIIKLRVQDLEKAKRLRGSIIVANHPTLIDVVILVTLFPHSIPMAKASLRKWIFLRPIFTSICIMNDEDALSIVHEAQDALSRGYNIIIFPEGTRTSPGPPPPLHRGTARMALLSGAPIQPVRLGTSEPLLSKEIPWWYPGEQIVTYSVKVLDPIPTQAAANAEAEPMSLVSRRLTRRLAEVLGLSAPAKS